MFGQAHADIRRRQPSLLSSSSSRGRVEISQPIAFTRGGVLHRHSGAHAAGLSKDPSLGALYFNCLLDLHPVMSHTVSSWPV